MLFLLLLLQGAPMDRMLHVMTTTAIYWIRAGLPLKCIKLVLYSANPEKDRTYLHSRSISAFRSLKSEWESKTNDEEVRIFPFIPSS